ncbi:hypothetical protein [Pseudomonas sp. Irchel 3E13]|uniref:hypothetical protein n=1 Tax=Pseudomonas sp. Irchel 3E13 TaxID=2008975 RepID=UPI00117B452F|nr:hypothetical protein [Pseudomonas sp. Irchel 3E13]
MNAHNLMTDELKHAMQCDVPFSWVSSGSVQEGAFGIYSQAEWDQRAINQLCDLWSAAGYDLEDADAFQVCAAKVVGSVRFHITDPDGTGMPHPDTACLVHAFDAEDHEFLELYREFPNHAALELAMPDLAVEAAANRC